MRMADVVVINKVDSAEAHNVEQVCRERRVGQPDGDARSSPSRRRSSTSGLTSSGKLVLVVDDGPTLTHGEMPFGAGLVAARNAGAAKIVDPRPYAVGVAEGRLRQVAAADERPAGDGLRRRAARRARGRRSTPTDCDVVVTGTPIDLARLITSRHPIRHVRYELEEVGTPTIADVLEPIVTQAKGAHPETVMAG